MGRGQAIIFTLLSGVITAAMLWFMPSDPQGQMFSVGGALFFGACTLVPASFIIRARVPEPELDGAVVVPNSTLRSLLMAVALIMIVAACVFLWPAIAADNDWRRFIFLIIPIPCALLALKYLQWAFDPRPAYRFDRQGVTRYQWGVRTTPWDAVTNVRVINTRGAENVVLDVTAEHRRGSGAMSRLSGATGFGDVSLPSGASGLSAQDIVALVRRFWSPPTI